MFDDAIKREMMAMNPAAAFDPSDAGGTEKSRERWLTRTELAQLCMVMRTATGWTCENTLTVKRLLMLAVRKSELIGARIDEFDLDAGTWHLPAERTKTARPSTCRYPCRRSTPCANWYALRAVPRGCCPRARCRRG